MSWCYLIAGFYVFMCSFCCEACGCNCFTWLWRSIFDGESQGARRQQVRVGSLSRSLFVGRLVG